MNTHDDYPRAESGSETSNGEPGGLKKRVLYFIGLKFGSLENISEARSSFVIRAKVSKWGLV